MMPYEIEVKKMTVISIALMDLWSKVHIHACPMFHRMVEIALDRSAVKPDKRVCCGNISTVTFFQ